jgi:quinol monooxygenase YgiN
VVTILLGVDGLKQIGCIQYTVGVAAADEVTIWASEVWESKQAHEASLELPEAKEAIAKAMPMLTRDFTRVETEMRGGLDL